MERNALWRYARTRLLIRARLTTIILKSMNPFKKWRVKADSVAKALKFLVLGGLGVFVILSFLSVVPSPYRGVSVREQAGFGGGVVAPSAPDYGYASKGYTVDSETSLSMPNLSVRNVLPVPMPGGTTGSDAEEYEVTDYNAYIETRRLEDTCQEIVGLKALDYVIFENSQESERNCSYTFKVEHLFVEDVLAFIEDLNPRDLSENSYTIKRQIDDYTNEEEILKNKLDSIEATLKSATAAYDEITRLATRTQDVATLAKIIDSKIQIIERLTQERINTAERLDRISRSKADQLDRLDYTYFTVNVSENTFIDGEYLKDSWKAAVRDFIRTVNQIFQDVTINLLAFLLFVIQAAIYIFIVLMVAKYGFKYAKDLLKK